MNRFLRLRSRTEKSRKKRIAHHKLLNVMFGLAISSSPALAVDIVWTGAVNGQWNNTGNWDISAVPTSADNAYLPSPSAVNNSITVPAGAVARQLIVNATYELLAGDLTTSDNFYVDSDNALTFSLKSSADVSTPNATVGLSGTSQSNVFEVAGSGTTFSVDNRLNVGWDGQQHSMNVNSGATATTATTAVGATSTATTNSLVVTGSGSSFSATSELLVGDNGTNNSFLLTVGATATSPSVVIGNNVGADGNSFSVNGLGSTFTTTDVAGAGLTVGRSSDNNTLSIGKDGTFSMLGATRDAQIGANAGSDGNTLEVTGGSFSTQGALYVGNGGSNNELNVSGGSATAQNVRIGGTSGSTGNIAEVSGTGTLTVNNTMRVGSSGSGNQLNITGGGKVSMPNNDLFVGYQAGSANNVVTISGAGSELEMGAGKNVVISFENGFVGPSFTPGNKVVVKDSGYLNTDHVELGPLGTLQFGDGAAPGTIKAGSTVNAPIAGGTVDFKHNSAGFTYGDALTGTLEVKQTGTGTTIFTGAKAYTGATSVESGELRVNGSTSASSAVSVSAGATLSGTGTVGGATTVNGTTAPGAAGAGQLTFGSNLSYNSGSNLSWQLLGNTDSVSTEFDSVQVNGNLNFTGATSAYLNFNSAGSTVDWTDSFWNSNRQWTLYNVAGTTSGAGFFSVFATNWADGNGALFNTVLPSASFSVLLSGNNVLLAYAVPEPSAWILGALSASLCWAGNRRMRKTAKA